MLIKFDQVECKRLKAFNGGEGEFCANMHVDSDNKILRGKLAQGSSIGLHTHETSSEIIFVLSGEGVMRCDGKEEILRAGDCHYCPKGSSHTLKNEQKEDLCFYAVVPNHS